MHFRVHTTYNLQLLFLPLKVKRQQERNMDLILKVKCSREEKKSIKKLHTALSELIDYVWCTLLLYTIPSISSFQVLHQMYPFNKNKKCYFKTRKKKESGLLVFKLYVYMCSVLANRHISQSHNQNQVHI